MMGRCRLQFLFAVALTGCGPMISSVDPSGSNAHSSLRPPGGVPYFLPKAALKVTLSDVNGQFQVIVGSPRYIADEKFPFLLQYRPSAFASDTAEIDVDPNKGLLSKIDMKAEDKLDDIAIEIARAAVVIAEAADERPGIILVEQEIDPANTEEVNNLVAEMNKRARTNALLQRKAACANKQSKSCIDYENIISGAVNINFLITKPQAYPDVLTDCNVGACFRVPMPYGISVDFGDLGSSYKTRVEIPNEMPAIPISLDRVSFVTKTAIIEFKDGMIDKVRVEKPSEALELVSLPLRIVGAVFDTIGKLIKFRIDTTDSETALATAQGKLIDAESKLREQRIASMKQEAAAEAAPLLVANSGGRRSATGIPNIGSSSSNSPEGQIQSNPTILPPLTDPGAPGTLDR
jgi:hypothetical protein